MVQTIFLYLCKHCLFNLTSYIKYIQNTMARLPFQAIVCHFYEFIISFFIFLIYIYKNTDVFYEDTKTHFLQVKKVVFVSQKGSFCTPKTILLQRKNHTFTRRICNTQITNTLRTLRECVSNGLQMCPNVLRMCGEHVYTGTINRPLRLLTACHFAANGLLIMQRTPTK